VACTVHPDSEDLVGRDRGAGRVVVTSRVAGDRAPRPTHDEAELDALKATAQQRMTAGQLELGPGLGSPGPSGPLPITSSRMSHLVDAFERAYRVLGLEDAAGGDEVFRHLVLAWAIERRASWTCCGYWRKPG
jgi:hypothetical protein